MTVQEIADYCCEQCGLPEWKGRIPVYFSNRMTTTFGRAYIWFWHNELSKEKSPYVKIAQKLWDRARPEQKRFCVVHEVCHVLAAIKYGRFIKPHGWEWSRLMRKCGEKPDRCHTVSTRGLKKKYVKEVQCSCGSISYIGPTQIQRLRNGYKWYKCPACKNKIEYYMVMK